GPFADSAVERKMKVPRVWWQSIFSGPFGALILLLAVVSSAAPAATIECVAQTRGSDVAQTLTEGERYGIRLTPAAVSKIQAEKEYCRSALVAGSIDGDTPAAMSAFLASSPLLQRLYLNAYGSDVQ